MARTNPQTARASEIWRLAGRQHGLVERVQLRVYGYFDEAIEHRIAPGRLHPVRDEKDLMIHVTVPPGRDIRQPSLTAHRRSTLDAPT